MTEYRDPFKWTSTSCDRNQTLLRKHSDENLPIDLFHSRIGRPSSEDMEPAYDGDDPAKARIWLDKWNPHSLGQKQNRDELIHETVGTSNSMSEDPCWLEEANETSILRNSRDDMSPELVESLQPELGNQWSFEEQYKIDVDRVSVNQNPSTTESSVRPVEVIQPEIYNLQLSQNDNSHVEFTQSSQKKSTRIHHSHERWEMHKTHIKKIYKNYSLKRLQEKMIVDFNFDAG